MNKKRETIEDGFFPEWHLWRGGLASRACNTSFALVLVVQSIVSLVSG